MEERALSATMTTTIGDATATTASMPMIVAGAVVVGGEGGGAKVEVEE